MPGHAGEALVGELHGRRIVAFRGRFHLYEGYDPEDVVYPIAVAAHAIHPIVYPDVALHFEYSTSKGVPT